MVVWENQLEGLGNLSSPAATLYVTGIAASSCIRGRAGLDESLGSIAHFGVVVDQPPARLDERDPRRARERNATLADDVKERLTVVFGYLVTFAVGAAV
jgi:hypothetical protein